MKKFLFLLSVFVLAVACSKKSTPGEVAVLLFNSITMGNVDDVKENIHFKDAVEYEVFCEYLDMVVASDEFKARTQGYDADYKVLSESVNGDTAHVELSGYTVLGQMTRFNVQLLRVDGSWKVDGSQAVIHGVK